MTFWRGRRVFLTGHTGFKGGWLALWLQHHGADVCGYALPPYTDPSFYEEASIASGMQSIFGDIRDLETLKASLHAWKPEVVLHLAAQPLVRASYDDPIGTYATNVMGTAHVLEAARTCPSVRSVVVVTTDKCYENKEWCWPYRETDALGGYDPYSNSKACTELVASAYRSSFFNPKDYAKHQMAMATGRAGNVIGGGDWSTDRLIPDMIRGFMSHEPVVIRNPLAIRPWQHVLEPLRGYLMLAQHLYTGTEMGEAWNFGPEPGDAKPVQWVADYLVEHWGGDASWRLADGPAPHEAQLLKLDSSKAASRLKWVPALTIEQGVDMTLDWYQEKVKGSDMRAVTLSQIAAYEARVQTQ